MSFKKTLLLLLGAGIITFSGCSSQQTNYQKLVGAQRWELLHLNRPDSLPKVDIYLLSNISPKKDPFLIDRWNSAKTTVEKGEGDCEDKAILGSYLAESLGYPPKVLFITNFLKRAHTLTFLEKRTPESTKYGARDSGKMFYPKYNSVDNLICDINKLYETNFSFYKIINLNSLNKDWRTTDKNLISLSDKIFGLTQVK